MISGYSGLASPFLAYGPNLWSPIVTATMLSFDVAAFGWSGLVIIPPLNLKQPEACAGISKEPAGVACKCTTRELMMRGCVCGAMAAEKMQNKV